MILIQDSNLWMGSYIRKGYFIFQMGHADFKFSSPIMTFQLQDISASTKLWNLYCTIFGFHKCEKLLRIMLRHLIYVPIPRLLIIVRTSYNAHYQFQLNLVLDIYGFHYRPSKFKGFWLNLCGGWRLTKMAHFIPSNKTVRGEETTRLLMDNIYKYYGLLDDIISNCGSKSPRSFGNHCSRSLKSRLNYLLHIILKLMDK